LKYNYTRRARIIAVSMTKKLLLNLTSLDLRR
jgi:hypothetical protein